LGKKPSSGGKKKKLRAECRGMGGIEKIGHCVGQGPNEFSEGGSKVMRRTTAHLTNQNSLVVRSPPVEKGGGGGGGGEGRWLGKGHKKKKEYLEVLGKEEQKLGGPPTHPKKDQK